jgi:hypothetical protein
MCQVNPTGNTIVYQNTNQKNMFLGDGVLDGPDSIHINHTSWWGITG